MATRDTRANKRKFGSGKGSPYAATSRRGPPAIFVTCESGREKKCQREALELMHHYYYLSRQAQDEENDTTIKQTQNLDIKGGVNVTGDDAATNNEEKKQQQQEKPLSLEEELSLLRKGVMAEEVLTYERNSKRQKGGGNKNKLSSMKSPFSEYESGVRGMICILCNLPGSELIPYDEIVAKIHAARKEKAENEASSTNDASEDKVVCEDKEKGHEEGNKTDTEKKHSLVETPLWDPVDTVKRIMEGVTEENNPTKTSKALSSAPSSRFISRMLPMQATCYSSVDEISLVVKSLLQTYLPSIIQKYKPSDAAGSISFKIDIKRRLCAHLTRDQVIETITPMLLGSDNNTEEDPEKKYGCKFSVNLSDPDFAIRIEVIKTLCGISILPRQEWYKNFNVAELIDAKEDNDKNN